MGELKKKALAIALTGALVLPGVAGCREQVNRQEVTTQYVVVAPPLAEQYPDLSRDERTAIDVIGRMLEWYEDRGFTFSEESFRSEIRRHLQGHLGARTDATLEALDAKGMIAELIARFDLNHVEPTP